MLGELVNYSSGPAGRKGRKSAYRDPESSCLMDAVLILHGQPAAFEVSHFLLRLTQLLD
jgi:hypothetical protein